MAEDDRQLQNINNFLTISFNKELGSNEPISASLQPHSQTSTRLQTPVEVTIQVFNNVSFYDYPQVLKTWVALDEAGLDSPDILSQALQKSPGGYQPNIYVTQQVFTQQLPLKESQMSQTVAMGYSKTADNHPILAQQITTPKRALSVTSAEVSLPTTPVGQERVKLVVVKKAAPTLINSSYLLEEDRQTTE